LFASIGFKPNNILTASQQSRLREWRLYGGGGVAAGFSKTESRHIARCPESDRIFGRHDRKSLSAGNSGKFSLN